MSKYLFIDGAYLARTFESFGRKMFDSPVVPIDYSLVQSIAGATKVFYYNAPPEPKTGEPEDEFLVRLRAYENLVSELYELPNWHVAAGVTKTRKNAKLPQSQKEVDVLIAVDMLSHTMRRNTTAMALIAGDRDFRPLVEALIREGMNLHLLFDPLSIDEELKRAADVRDKLHIRRLYDCLQPSFRDANAMPHYGLAHGVPYTPLPEKFLKETATAKGQRVTIHRFQNDFVAIKHGVDGWQMHEYAFHLDLNLVMRFATQMWGCEPWVTP